MAHVTTISASALALDQTFNGAYSILDPITNIFYYLVPKLGTVFSGTKIRKGEDLGEDLLGAKGVREGFRKEIEVMAKATGIERKVSAYFGNTFASYGGKYSLTSPVIQIPFWHLVRTEDYGNFGAANNEIQAPLADGADKKEMWRYSDQETRFLILRSLVQIRMNDSMFKTIARVAMLAAIVLLKVSPFIWPLSLTLFLLAVTMYFVVDRYTQKRLDSEALKSLIKLTTEKLDHEELKDPNKVLKVKNEAIDAAISVMKKQKEQNLQLKSKRRLANFLIDKEGNDRFRLTAPKLTERIRLLEEGRAQFLIEEPRGSPSKAVTEARIEEYLLMGKDPFVTDFH